MDIEKVKYLAADMAAQVATLSAQIAAMMRELSEPRPTPLETFLAEQCYQVPGASILFSEFFERFKFWMEQEEIEGRRNWISKMKVIKALPQNIPYGIKHSNQRYVGNLSWEPGEPSTSLVVKKGKLKPK